MPKHDPDREKRLAEALRANLRRRKAGGKEPAPAEPENGNPDPHPGR